MAGETIKTTALSDAQSGKAREARLNATKERVGTDSYALTTSDTQANDVLLTNIRMPSNAIVREVKLYSDELDDDGSPTLTIDVGLAAAKAFTSVTSGSSTKHAEDSILEANTLVDGSTDVQGGTNKFTSQDLEINVEDVDKALWEHLGYDEDPNTEFLVSVKFPTASTGATEGTLALQVHYLVD